MQILKVRKMVSTYLITESFMVFLMPGNGYLVMYHYFTPFYTQMLYSLYKWYMPYCCTTLFHSRSTFRYLGPNIILHKIIYIRERKKKLNSNFQAADRSYDRSTYYYYIFRIITSSFQFLNSHLKDRFVNSK